MRVLRRNNMNKKQARAYGIQRGFEAVANCDYDPNIDTSVQQAARESEENSRQYADFVNGFASAVLDDPEHRQDGLWDAYSEGVERGIIQGLKKLNAHPSWTLYEREEVGEIMINAEQGLYIVPQQGGGYSCLGFEYAHRIATMVYEWLVENGQTPLVKPTEDLIGTQQGWATYEMLMRHGGGLAQLKGIRCNGELTPELIGLEGKKVRVVDCHDNMRIFWVGKSTGWLPIHLEIEARSNHGGGGVTGTPFKSVLVVPDSYKERRQG